MGKIRQWVIHLLGGMTYEDIELNNMELYWEGRHTQMQNIMVLCNALYGEKADEWCDQMYRFLKLQHERANETLNEIKKKIYGDK